MNNPWNNTLKDFFSSTIPDEAKRELVDLLELNQRGREDICVFVEEILGVSLNNFQRNFLVHSTTSRALWLTKFGVEIEDIGGYLFGRNIACPSNQVGKTIMIAIKHLWFNYYKIGLDLEDTLIDKAHYQTLNISPHSRQVKQCYNYIKEILEERFIIDEEGKKRVNKLHALMKDFLTGENSTLGELRFRNKSVFYTVPTGQDQAASLAGAQFGYISYDECYSEDTEVLTEKGWKLIKDVRVGERVPSLNLETGKVEDANVRAVINKKYKGKMVQFGGAGHRFDLLVTPGHRMVAATRASSKAKDRYKAFTFHEAKNLLGKEHLLTQAFERKTDEPMQKMVSIEGYSKKLRVGRPFSCEAIEVDAKAYFEFVGLFLTEGSVNKNMVVISQTPKGNAYDRIPKVLDALGFGWKKAKGGFLICNSQLARHLERAIPKYSYAKRIPRWMLAAHPTLLALLFDGIVAGDGWMKGNNRCGYVGTASVGLADDYMELFLSLGFVPSMKKIASNKKGGWVNGQHIISHRDFYIINFRKDYKTPRCGIGRNERFADSKEVNYDGRVYCLNLDRNNTLMVRRNGRVAWSGNCAQSLHLENELGAKIMSRLIKYGVALDLISTPEVDSPSHQYYLHIVKLGFAGKEGWWALNGILDDNKFIPKLQRDRAKADLLSTNKQKYRQVVFGDFISGGKRFFDPKEVEQMWRLSGKIACQPKHLYLLVSDWGMSDTGDESVFKIFDYTNWGISGKIQIVNHEAIKGGSPYMQFALLRTLYDGYTWYDDDGVTAHKPTFVMDAKALGGVVIKKLLAPLQPRAFNIEKDEALMLLKKEMSSGRDYYESEVDGAVIEKNPGFGSISSYFIEELSEQLGTYHIEDKKLRQDFVMTLMMGVSYIARKFPKQMVKKVELNHLAGYNTQVSQPSRTVRGNIVRVHQMLQ